MLKPISSVQFNSVAQSCWIFVTPWTAAYQAFLSITDCQSFPKLTSIESVMPSNHLILCRPLLLLPSIFPRIGVFSNESALLIRWPKYWTMSFTIKPTAIFTYYENIKALFNPIYFAFLFLFFPYLSIRIFLFPQYPTCSILIIVYSQISGISTW